MTRIKLRPQGPTSLKDLSKNQQIMNHAHAKG